MVRRPECAPCDADSQNAAYRLFAASGYGNLQASKASGLSLLAVLNSYVGNSSDQLGGDGAPLNQACMLGVSSYSNHFGRKTQCSDGGASSVWGRDQRGKPVAAFADWSAAVELLRSPEGHDPSSAWRYAYPPPWWMLDFNQNEPSRSDPSSGTPGATVAGLEAAAGMRTLAVMHQGCGTFTLSTIDPRVPAYWGEHWEVYKQAYVAARWLWDRGVAMMELANEPDLKKYNLCVSENNTDVIARACALGVTPLQYVDMYYADISSVRERATQDAYEDGNADAAAGRVKCPRACPLAPVIYAHGWSRNVLLRLTGNIQGAVLANQHFRFGVESTPNWSPTHTSPVFPWGGDVKYAAFDSWSYHSYGRTPSSLRDQVQAIVAASADPGGDTQYTPGGVLTPMPVALTELGPLLVVTYGQQGDSSDEAYQAARGASQLAMMARWGHSSFVYKFSMQAAASSTADVTYLQKSGMTWADNTDGSFAIGDVTRTGVAMAMMLPYLAGSVPLLTCVFATSADEGMTPCVAARAADDVVHVFLVNDCTNAQRAAAGLPGETGCADRTFDIDPSSLGAHASSVLSVAELSVPAASCLVRTDGSRGVVSRGTFPCPPGETPVTSAAAPAGRLGEVAVFSPLAKLPPTGLRYTLPAFSTVRITIPLRAQVERALPQAAAASVFAGGSPPPPPSPGALLVGISQTEVHDETAVALLRFDLSAAAGLTGAAPSLALLQLTLLSAPRERVVLALVGANPASPPDWASSSVDWASSAWLLRPTPLGAVRTIGDNFVRLGGGNWLVGHLSLAPEDGDGALKQLDLTRFVAAAMAERACSVTLAVTRRVQRNAAAPASPFGDVIPADDLAGGLAAFYGAPAAEGLAPALRVVSDAASPPYVCLPRADGEAERRKPLRERMNSA